MKQNELNEILTKHELWLKHGVGGVKANLCGADLCGADLYGADLYGADLSGANLSHANLSHANLSHADLSRTNLSRTNLYGANLSGADLSGANLSGANLYDADLSRANLSHANLSGANLSHANLSHANLSHADLYVLTSNAIGIQVISLSKHRIIKYQNTIQIGCEKHSVQYWLDNFKEMGKKNGYSEKEIKQYGNMIKLLAHSSFNS